MHAPGLMEKLSSSYFDEDGLDFSLQGGGGSFDEMMAGNDFSVPEQVDDIL